MFKYTIKAKENYCLITFDGNLMTKEEAGSLLDEVTTLVIKNKNVIIDTGLVKYISSEGLGILIQILTKCRKNGGDAIVVNLSKDVKNLFIITKLSHIFATCENVKEAEKLLKEQEDKNES